MLNIHPSLLPKYKGLHTHQQALEAGDKQHGVTIHFVTEELDGGPPIIQAVVPVKELDTLQTLAQRVLQQEHIIYPMAVNWFIEGRLQLQDNRVQLDGQPLPPQGCRLDTTEAATEEIPMS
jgi:phosphoribosylglycinamide formyltransferase-1